MSAPPFSAARATLVRLASMCTAMPAHELYGWLERLKLRRRDQDVVAAAVTLAPAIVERLSGPSPPPPSELHELLAGQPLEVLVLAAAYPGSDEVESRLRAYLERIRGVRLEISGDDLRAAGVPESPAIGEALRQTLRLKLDGFATGPDEELRTALRLLGRGRSK
jgi:tRNA nucleotidyltransferase (CCA-adding enzyme)